MQLADPASVRLITSQGVNEEWARFALASCGDDVDASVAFIFSTDMNAAIAAARMDSGGTTGAGGRERKYSATSSADLHESYATVADDHAECAICFEPLCRQPCAVFVDRSGKRVCFHFFHKTCADDLASNFNDCPLCRAEFTATLEVPDISANPDEWFKVCDKDGDGDLNTREVFEILKAQFPVDYVRLEKDLPKLWRRWDPSMDGQIQKEEFLGPNGLLAFVRKNFLAQRRVRRGGGGGGGSRGEGKDAGDGKAAMEDEEEEAMPDIRHNKMAWFKYFDEDGSGELSQQEVARGLIKSLNLAHGPGGLHAVDEMKRTVANVWAIFDTDGSGEVDASEFVSRDGLADTIIASLQHA